MLCRTCICDGPFWLWGFPWWPVRIRGGARRPCSCIEDVRGHFVRLG